MKKIIIDGHSHLGNELFTKRKEIFVEDYDNFCMQTGINVGLVMPVPCPIINEKNKNKILLTWEYKHDKFIDVTETEFLRKRELHNPYLEINQYYFNQIKNIKTKTKLFFVPMIHPRLDTPEYIEKMILEMDPIAIKVHSVGTASSPNDINEETLKILKEYNIPLIVHTDYDNGKFKENEGLSRAVQKASPIDWFNFFENNKIKGVLNHGATLNSEVFNKVNRSKYVMIAIGPDGYLNSNYGRFQIKKDIYDQLGYLGVLKKYVNPNKLIFDIDYDYNQVEGKMDFNSIERIKRVWSNKKDQENILGQNLIFFFPKLLNKLQKEIEIE